ncbi:MAG: ribosome small subunit-dependent GTPase A [Candidatus Latescibacterota bacterium]|jgi:ribosome biogenesis GTPase
MDALTSLGFGEFFARQFDRFETPELVPARVSSEGRGVYHLLGCRARVGELRGRLRHELDREHRPVVGDWVAVVDGGQRATIHHVLDRRTTFFRRAAGSESEVQVIAANVDLFFVVTSANRDFNVRRLERFLAAVWDSGAEPVVVLNKTDLAETVEDMVSEIDGVAIGVPVVRTSATLGTGLDDLRAHLGVGKTVGLVGSSGVGKSSLVNRLLGVNAQPVETVRRDEKGRHTTTRRELVELPGGGLLIDTPGIREFGLVDDAGGVGHTFEDILELAQGCRFRDCTHRDEPGCAVAEAVEAGELDAGRLAGFHKLQREIAAAERRRDPKLAGRSKLRWKEIHKEKRRRAKSDPKLKRDRRS